MKTHLEDKIIPLAILWTIVFISIIATISTDNILGINVLHGSLLLIICTFGFVYNKKFYRYVTFATLLLGVLGVVEFSFYEATVAFGLDGVGSIVIHVLPTIVLLIFLYLHQDQIRNTFFSKRSKVEELDAKTFRVKAFKSRFSNLSDQEIERRLNDKMVPEAFEALRQLKKERGEEE